MRSTCALLQWLSQASLVPWTEAPCAGEAPKDTPRGMGGVRLGPRKRGSLVALTLLSALAVLPGCRSSLPLPPRAEASTKLDADLAASIAQVARAGDKPQALARAEAAHRRLLAARLTPLLDAATRRGPRPV